MEIPPKSAPRIFLIDAYALIYRSYFAFISRPLTNAAGENTSAPFGFTRFLLDVREKFEPDYLAVVFDAGVSFRDVEYPEYKATREKMPDDLRASLGRIRAIVEAFHDPVVELDGYEADDVIALNRADAHDALRGAAERAGVLLREAEADTFVCDEDHLIVSRSQGAADELVLFLKDDGDDAGFAIIPEFVNGGLLDLTSAGGEEHISRLIAEGDVVAVFIDRALEAQHCGDIFIRLEVEDVFDTAADRGS